jgi:hypothetical protein
MRKSICIFLLCAVAVFAAGCESKKDISREEIPIIKESIVAFEKALKLRDPILLDSLLSSEARQVGTAATTVLDFVYGDGRTEFTGFTNKQIFFRGDAARCDCTINGGGIPAKDVTITLKKENNVWLIKRIEPRLDSPLKVDSTGG